MHQMVFLDIDGTILSSKGELSPQLIDTIHRLKQKGVLIGLATGRSFQASKPYGDLLGCNLYVVYNGGLVIDNEEVIFDHRIPCEVAHYACSRTHELGGTFIHYFRNYSCSNRPALNEEYLLPLASPCEIRETKRDAHRLALYLNQEQRAKLIEEITDASCFDEGDRIEVFHKGSKWTGILPMLKKYGVTADKVITIGNSFNDIAMIENAGMGIAMGNAPEGVKTVANRVTKNNDDQGAVYALQHIFGL
jgi:Cof subfamily protein (haloacid dehalogenase superfamily)